MLDGYHIFMKTTSYLDFQSVCNVSKRQNEHSQMTVGRRQGRSCNDAGDGKGCNPGARARFQGQVSMRAFLVAGRCGGFTILSCRDSEALKLWN